MALDWESTETTALGIAMGNHPIESGRCAALARRVMEVATPRDSGAHGLQVRPRSSARFVVPKHTPKPRWNSHTLVSTRSHCVDALSGIPGCPDTEYLATHWEYPDQHVTSKVDVYEIDPGIEDGHE